MTSERLLGGAYYAIGGLIFCCLSSGFLAGALWQRIQQPIIVTSANLTKQQAAALANCTDILKTQPQ
jgi:hypothetical protein